MNFSKMSDVELVLFRDDLNRFHTGISGNTVKLIRTDGSEICIRDDRIEDLIFTLFIEAHNELCERFKNKIGEIPME